MEKSTIYSIGHGNKNIEIFIEELRHFDINYLIDIRSKPYSKYSPHFNQNSLKISLLEKKIAYAFMGDVLGGLPDDQTCYTNGHVDYEIIKEKEFFKNGLQRLIAANNKKIKVAIMCSESKPEECHRTKLIGEELKKFGIDLNHITRTKNTSKQLIIKSQNDVMLEVAPKGTVNLFGEKMTFGSKKKYNQDAI
ncbi:MAG: DUF488 domain-containing protein [Bacteroidales bacterium]|nr:DUF488 domain-containing protein [Bacteroidales bacterium]